MINQIQYHFKQIGNCVEKVIVAIHGWQGDQNSMKPLVKSIKIPNSGWYFLDAPYLVKDGKGRSWSYQKSNGKWEVDEPTQLLRDFFYKIFKKYQSKNIYVLGFSQGAMVCLEFVLHLDQPLGGVFPISGFLRYPDIEIDRFHPCQRLTPILIGHGKSDETVPSEASEKAYHLLKNQGANVNLFLYNGQHKIGIDYLRKMTQMILI